jgi:5-methylcytosine-specific restriction endonuclease McrA
MADFPALPLWTDAYLSDTRELSTLEHGAYLLLLMTAWRTADCSLPDDDRLLARWAGLDRRTWARVRPVMERFWTICEGRWRSRRSNCHYIGTEHHPSNWPDGRWATVRKAVLARDGEVCSYCGTTAGPFDVDHVVPRSRGGTNSADNLVVACAPCNRSKGARTPEEWRA